MKKISIIKNDKNIIIKFEAPILLKVHIIEIELLNMHQYQLDNELKKLKQENIELKKRIEELEIKHDKEINKLKKYLRTNKSVIMEENENKFIFEEIQKKVNKEVIEIKKLYQASIDGDDPDNFHSRCHYIPNTLVLIKSAGNRRFGGFITEKWNANDNGVKIDDPKSFLFSLDKKKIYHYKKGGFYIDKYRGPCFGDVEIGDHGIFLKNLYTRESNTGTYYDFQGVNNALSEDGKGSGIHALEYEVFQVVLRSFID